MRQDIIIAGVGGQGILSIATIIGRAVLSARLHLKQSEVHGMAQRGGAVQTHLRISDGPIHSDLVPLGKATLILSLEPMEALRYASWLAPEGWLVSNREPVENIAAYPALEGVLEAIAKFPRHLVFDATALAREQGAPRAANVAMLGAASPFLGFSAEALETAIQEHFARKGDTVVQSNLAVFRMARERGEAARKAQQA